MGRETVALMLALPALLLLILSGNLKKRPPLTENVIEQPKAALRPCTAAKCDAVARSTKMKAHDCTTWACLKRNIKGYDLFLLLEEVVHPFAPWYLCTHYLGNELPHWVGWDTFGVLQRHHNIQKLTDCANLPYMAIVFVQSNYFDEFVSNCFSKLKVKIILITGQWHKPALVRSNYTDAVLRSPYVHSWYTQNTFSEHKKLIQIPYGIMHSNLPAFAQVVGRLQAHTGKERLLKPLPLSSTNPNRSALVQAHTGIKLQTARFYEEVASSKFVLSPQGDRPDCHRHAEAIGLGTCPICDCPRSFSRLYRNTMIFASADSMVEYLHDNSLLENFKCDIQDADQDILSIGYWAQQIRASVHKL